RFFDRRLTNNFQNKRPETNRQKNILKTPCGNSVKRQFDIHFLRIVKHGKVESSSSLLPFEKGRKAIVS
ncbi:hypothetical protein, partial [Ruegeria arenilitoris]